MKPQLHFDLPSTGHVHCDDARSIVEIQDKVEKKKGEVIKKKFAYVDEDLLDIFSETSKKILLWTPKTNYKKYAQLTFVVLDIETLRINNALNDIREKARENRIMAIGIRSEGGHSIYIREDSERLMLLQLFRKLEQKQPDLLLTYNGMWFDLPFIVERAKQLGIEKECPFWIDYTRQPSKFAAATIAGRYFNEYFRAVHCKLKTTGKKVSHIDLYMRAIAWDAIMRKAPGKMTLKTMPVILKLRKDDGRLDLGLEGIEECYRTEDWETLWEYLEDDLKDTHLLADRFVPEVVNEQAFFPGFTIQALATIGVGTKWQAAWTDYYGQEYVDSLPEPQKIGYKGAISFAKVVFTMWVVSYDFSGQYPTCMDMYGIISKHDPDNIGLAILRRAKEERDNVKYKFERIGVKPTQEEKEFAQTVKTPINGLYGALAANIPHGDPEAAALVTAFARARLKWSRKFVQAMGGDIVLTDTDSLYIVTNKDDIHIRYPIPEDILEQLPPDAPPQLLSAVAIGETLKHYIPSGSKLDLDSINKMMFVPPAQIPSDFNKSYKFSAVNGRKLVERVLSDDPKVYRYALRKYSELKVTFDRLVEIADHFELNFPAFEPVRKSYCKITWEYDPKTKTGEWEQKAKGRFAKRVTIKLEKEFPQEFMLRYAEDPAKADEYYREICQQILLRQYPLEKLQVNRKIGKGEKKLIELGFGKVREDVTFWVGESGEPTQSEPYNIEYYLDKVNVMYQELTCLLDVKM